jgi:Domain of unknown function (DUF4760)
MTTQTIGIPAPLPIEHKLLGETYGYWCQTLVLLAAVIFAYFQIRSARAIERQKAAIDRIFEMRSDLQLKEATRQIATVHAGDKNIATYGKVENKGCPEAKHIRYALNQYEYISVAISLGIYDDAIFKNSMYGTLIELYDRTKPFIDERRKHSGPTTWQEFECLACRWKERPLQKKTIKAVEDRSWRKRLFGD